MKKVFTALAFLIFCAGVSMAQRGTAELDYYPMGYAGDTWTGEVRGAWASGNAWAASDRLSLCRCRSHASAGRVRPNNCASKMPADASAHCSTFHVARHARHEISTRSQHPSSSKSLVMCLPASLFAPDKTVRRKQMMTLHFFLSLSYGMRFFAPCVALRLLLEEQETVLCE